MDRRITIRITNNQQLVLQELTEKLNCSYSLLVRTIIGHWLAEHDDELENLITNNELKQ